MGLFLFISAIDQNVLRMSEDKTMGDLEKIFGKFDKIYSELKKKFLKYIFYLFSTHFDL